MPDQTVGGGVIAGLVKFAVSRGAEVQALLHRADLLEIPDHDCRILLAAYLNLIRAAKELTGDPAFALHFGSAVDVSELSIVGLLTHASETMLDALAQINRYGRLAIDTRPGAEDLFQLRRRFNKLWLVDTRPRPTELNEITEVSFAQLVTGTRRIGIGGWLKSVQVTHRAPSYREAYDEVFGVPVEFGRDWNALEFDEAYLNHPVAVSPRYVFGILSERADTLLADLERSKTARGQVESTLLPILHTGPIPMDQVASKLGISRQSLYRRLKVEGFTFEQIVDDLRRSLSLDYLRGRRVSVNEAAYLVGYSDPSVFSRAVKRWTGLTPRELRRSPDGGEDVART